MQSKVGPYFTYAIGEILLVVLGILIALQINNNNQYKKDRDYERVLLTALHESVLKDLRMTEQRINRLKNLDTAYRNVNWQWGLCQSGLEYTLNDRDISRLTIGVSRHLNNGAYQAIKSSGIQIIKDDSLRSAIVEFYDYVVPRQLEFIAWYDRDYESDSEWLWAQYQLDGVKLDTLNKEVSKLNHMRGDLFELDHFEIILRNVNRRRRNLMRQHSEIQTGLMELDSLISQRLEALSN